MYTIQMVVMFNNDMEEYLGIVLSQIQFLDLKRVVAKLLHARIDEMLQKQCFSNVPEEQPVKMVLANLGDPVKLGQFYVWLYKSGRFILENAIP